MDKNEIYEKAKDSFRGNILKQGRNCKVLHVDINREVKKHNIRDLEEIKYFTDCIDKIQKLFFKGVEIHKKVNNLTRKQSATKSKEKRNKLEKQIMNLLYAEENKEANLFNLSLLVLFDRIEKGESDAYINFLMQ